MTDTPGPIPQSTALAEATPDSLSELFSRDPEGYQRQDLDKIIAELRAQRVRWEAAGAAAPQRAPKGQGKVPLGTSTTANAGDLGL